MIGSRWPGLWPFWYARNKNNLREKIHYSHLLWIAWLKGIYWWQSLFLYCSSFFVIGVAYICYRSPISIIWFLINCATVNVKFIFYLIWSKNWGKVFTIIGQSIGKCSTSKRVYTRNYVWPQEKGYFSGRKYLWCLGYIIYNTLFLKQKWHIWRSFDDGFEYTIY